MNFDQRVMALIEQRVYAGEIPIDLDGLRKLAPGWVYRAFRAFREGDWVRGWVSP